MGSARRRISLFILPRSPLDRDMSRLVRCLCLPLLFVLLAAGCKKEATTSAAPEPAKEHQSPAPTDSGGSKPTPPADDKPPAGILAISETGADESGLRTALVFEPGETSGGTGVVAVLPFTGKTPKRSIYYWSENSGRWEGGALIRALDKIAFYQVPAIGSAPPLPSSAAITGAPAWTVEWGDPLQARETKESPVEQELNQRYTAILEKQREQGRQMARDNGAPQQDRQAWMERQKRDREERTAIMEELRQVQEEARAAKVTLRSSSQRAVVFSRKPKFVRWSGPVGAPPPAGLLLPGYGLKAAASPEGTVATVDASLAVIQSQVSPTFGKSSFWLEVSGTAVQVRCVSGISGGLASRPEFKIGAVLAGTPPGEPESTYSSTRDDGTTVVGIHLPDLPADSSSVFEVRAYYRGTDKEPWWISKPARVILKSSAGKLGAECTDAGADLKFQTVPDSQSKQGLPVEELGRVLSPGEITRCCLAGNAGLVVLATDAGGEIRWYDTGSLKPAGSLGVEGDPRAVAIAGDARRIFVVDRDGQRLRAVSPENAAVLAERKLTAADRILALAAAPFVEGPVLALCPDAMVLLDPVTLADSREEFFAPWGEDSSSPGSRWEGWQRNSLNRAAKGTAIAAPDGSGFSVDVAGPTTDTGHPAIGLRRGVGGWKTRQGSSVPGWSGDRFEGSRYKGVDDAASDKIRSKHSGTLLPCLGMGCLEMQWQSAGTLTFPPAPALLAWHSSAGGEPVEFAAAPGVNTDKERTVRGSLPLWFNPETRRVLSAAGRTLLLEEVDKEAWNKAAGSVGKQLINRPPAAQRGAVWSFAPRVADCSSLAGTPLDAVLPFPLHWNGDHLEGTVPAAFPDDRFQVSLKLADGNPLSFEAPITGVAPGEWLLPDGKTTEVQAKVLGFGEPVDRIELGGGDTCLLVSSRNFSRATVVDLKTLEPRPAVDFPGGPALGVVTGAWLYRWDQASGVLTKWSFPELKMEPVAGILRPDAVKVIFAGRLEEKPVLRALAGTSSSTQGLGRINPETLAFEDGVVVSGIVDVPTRNRGRSLIGPLRVSADGRAALFPQGGLMTLEDVGKPKFAIEQSASQRTSLADDGSVIYNGKTSIDLLTKRNWELPDKGQQNENAQLVAACGSTDFMAVTPGAGKEAGRITIYDGNTKEAKLSLAKLPELGDPVADENSGGGRNNLAACEHVILASKAGVLVTLDSGCGRVVLRRLPAAGH